MSDTDRRMSDAAIPISKALSALHFFGIMMPKRKFKLNIIIYKNNLKLKVMFVK